MPGGTSPLPPSRTVSQQVVSDEADRDDEEGQQTSIRIRLNRRTSGAGWQAGAGRCARQCGGDGEQCHDDDHGPQQAVAAGDAEAEVEVPRQQQREDEQGDRHAVPQHVGAGGHVSGAGRPGDCGRSAGRHRDGGGRVVTLVAHVTILSV